MIINENNCYEINKKNIYCKKTEKEVSSNL